MTHETIRFHFAFQAMIFVEERVSEGWNIQHDECFEDGYEARIFDPKTGNSVDVVSLPCAEQS